MSPCFFVSVVPSCSRGGFPAFFSSLSSLCPRLFLFASGCLPALGVAVCCLIATRPLPAHTNFHLMFRIDWLFCTTAFPISSFSISCLFCSPLCPVEMLNHLGLTCHGSPVVWRRSSVVLLCGAVMEPDAEPSLGSGDRGYTGLPVLHLRGLIWTLTLTDYSQH